MPEIKWTKKDTQLVEQLREHLNNKTVNYGLLNDLLTSLEGKQIPSNGKQRQRRNLKSGRVARNLNNIMSSLKTA